MAKEISEVKEVKKSEAVKDKEVGGKRGKTTVLMWSLCPNFVPSVLNLAGSADDERKLEEKVEDDQERAKKNQESGPAQTAARDAAQRADQMRRSGLEAGLFAGTVERPDSLVARECSAQ
jgi:hypothetical protein